MIFANPKSPNIQGRDMKGLLINNKREGRFMYFSSLFDMLNSVRSGALLLNDTYYNPGKGTWEELDTLKYLKNKAIPLSKKKNTLNRL